MSNIRFASRNTGISFGDDGRGAEKRLLPPGLFLCHGDCPGDGANIRQMFDFKQDCIDPDGMHGGWQTSGTVRVCRLAFNLWNGYTDPEHSNAYSPEDLFCCEFAPYFMEGIKSVTRNTAGNCRLQKSRRNRPDNTFEWRNEPWQNRLLPCGNTRRSLSFSPYWSRTTFPRQKEEVQALVGYIDGMEEKLSQMMEEMKAMRLEVEKLHDKGIRARCAQLVGTAEGKNPPGKNHALHCQDKPRFRCRAHCGDSEGKGTRRPAPCGAGAAYPCRPLPNGARVFPRKPGDGAVRRETGCDPGGAAPGGQPHERRRARPGGKKNPWRPRSWRPTRALWPGCGACLRPAEKPFPRWSAARGRLAEKADGEKSSVKTELHGLKSAQAGQRRKAAGKEQAR